MPVLPLAAVSLSITLLSIASAEGFLAILAFLSLSRIGDRRACDTQNHRTSPSICTASSGCSLIWRPESFSIRPRSISASSRHGLRFFYQLQSIYVALDRCKGMRWTAGLLLSSSGQAAIGDEFVECLTRPAKACKNRHV